MSSIRSSISARNTSAPNMSAPTSPSLSSGTPSTSDDGSEKKLSQVENPMAKDRLVKSPSLPSSPTSVTIERRNTSSSADIASDLLNDQAIETPQVVHGHKLPAGWSCSYDPITDEYNFELVDSSVVGTRLKNDQFVTQDKGVLAQSPTRDSSIQTSRRPTFHLFERRYQFPSSPTSSMISELARQVQKTSAAPAGSSAAGGAADRQAVGKSRHIGYGKNRLVVPSDEEEQKRRLCDMFPTATEQVVEQMMRIYHGREGLIKAALVSLGYKRSSEYSARQTSAQSPVMLMMSKPSSKKLFEKLVGYFPDKDEALIKSLMYEHKEVEHEIISALVEEGHRDGLDYQRAPASTEELDDARGDRNGAIMKLRYLKVLFPTCNEIELYHLLHCNDLNVQRVMEVVENRGHTRANIEEVLESRKSQTQQMKAQHAAHVAKDKPPSAAHDLVEAHKKRIKPSPAGDRIEASKNNLKKDFDQIQDDLLLVALKAADYNEALAKKFLNEMEPIDEALYLQRYHLELDPVPDVVAFPCKAVQKNGTNYMSIMAHEYVYVPREVIECDHALALLKVDACTFTGDDFPNIRASFRRGRDVSLCSGPQFLDSINERQAGQKLRRASGHVCPRKGSQYKELCASRGRPNSSAMGRNESLARGADLSLRSGHDSNLIRRTHPFFKETSRA